MMIKQQGAQLSQMDALLSLENYHF